MEGKMMQSKYRFSVVDRSRLPSQSMQNRHRVSLSQSPDIRHTEKSLSSSAKKGSLTNLKLVSQSLDHSASISDIKQRS